MSEQSCLSGMVLTARQEVATVVSQRKLAEGTFAIRLKSPVIAQRILPGQFFMIRPKAGTDPLLGRPFALYDTIVDAGGTPTEFEFAYHVMGKLTGLMSQWSGGESVELWGPLGNGFPVYRGQHLACVGGGIGYTPFLAVARETLAQRQYGEDNSRYDSTSVRKVTLCYGARNKAHRADLSDFDELQQLSIILSTDDGSEGHHGFVTDLVTQLFEKTGTERPDGVYCCGPEPMMHAVARLCKLANVDCWLSLETPMACGFGACFSCVTKVDVGNGEWDYRRTCVEGPVFPAHMLVIP